MTRNMIYLIALLMLPTPVLADLVVTNAWIRMPPPVTDTAAGYMLLTNDGVKSVEVVAVSTTAANESSFHRTVMDQHTAKMVPIKTLIIAAGESMAFTSGGNHLMLMGINRPMTKETMVTIELKLRSGKQVVFQAEVRDVRATPEQMHHHH